MIKVFLADDEYFVRTSLKNNIPWHENGLEIIGEANTGDIALEKITQLHPDIAILDINMPGLTGIEVISHLRAKNIDCCYIILTGYDEFEYAQQAIHLGVHDYILKPIDYEGLIASANRLKEGLLVAREQDTKVTFLQNSHYQYELEQYFSDLISCNLALEGDYSYEMLATKSLKLPHYTSYGIILMKFLSPCERETLKVSLKDAPLDCTYLFRDMQRNFYLVYNTSDAALCQRLIEYLQTTFTAIDITVKIGIGNSYPSMNHLYLSYTEAQIALKNVSVHGVTNIMWYQEINDTYPLTLLDQKSRNRIKAFILNKNLGRLRETILDLYAYFIETRCSFDSITLASIQLINLLIEVLSAQSCLPVSVSRQTENILDTLSGATDIKTVTDKVLSIYEDAINYVNDSTISNSNISTKIEDYINKNYANPELTIPMIAENLFLNYSYLCSCFKRDSGITINDYLNSIRIRHAVEMFDAKITNVSYVSEKCGYMTPGYFSKRFRKEIGISPSEYLRGRNL